MSKIHHHQPIHHGQTVHHRPGVQHQTQHSHGQHDSYEGGQHHQHAPHHHGRRLHVPAQGIGGHHQHGRHTGFNANQAAPGNNLIANNALHWDKRGFKPGQTKRCADWVSNVLGQSGAHFRRTEAAAGFANQGTAVSRQNLKPGDVVLFGNTYKKGKYTHVGIYVGNGLFEHRPTARRPVELGSLDSKYWRTHFTGGRHIQ